MNLFKKVCRRLFLEDSPSAIAMGRLVATGIGFINVPLIAWLVGAEGRGETAAVLAAFYLVPILLGIGMPLEVRRLATQGEYQSVARASKDIAWSMLIPAFGIALLLIETVFQSLNQHSRIATFVGISLAPMMISWMCDQSILIARKEYRKAGSIQLCQPFVNLIFILVLIPFVQVKVEHVIWSAIVSQFITMLLGLLLVRHGIFGDRYSYAKLFRKSLSFFGGSIAEAASNRLDQVLLLPVMGSFQLGLYSVAATISTMPIMLGHALGATYFNSLARAPEELKKSIKITAINSTLALSLGFSLFLALFSPLAITLLFGAEFRGAILVTFISLIGSIALTPAFVCSMLLVADGRGGLMTIGHLISVISAVIGIFIFATTMGAVGAAIASTVSYILLFIALCNFSGIGIKKIRIGSKEAKQGIKSFFRKEI